MPRDDGVDVRRHERQRLGVVDAGHDADGGAIGIGMPLIGLLWVALLVSIGLGLGWLLFRDGQRRAGAGAREVLGTRYARGELDRDSYLRMRADLAEQAPTAR